MDLIPVTFPEEHRTLQAEPGTTILAAQIQAGLVPDAPCGGTGRCGKCRVEIRRPGETAWTQVLACQTAIETPLEVRSVGKQNDTLRVLTASETKTPEPLRPVLRQVALQLDGSEDGLDGWSRLKRALETQTGLSGLEPDTSLASGLYHMRQQNRGAMTALLFQNRIVGMWTGTRQVYLAAFDIGTTTIAGYLLRPDEQTPVASAGMRNPQTQYGADVIQRANYVLQNGDKALFGCVRQAINALLQELCDAAGAHREDIYAISVVGNTCMHHLFLGISPRSLVRTPYMPAICEPLVLRAADYDLQAAPGALLLCLPVIAGFIGSDTVGCMLAVHWEQLEELTLLIDIGTNGELVLGTKKRMVACSTAAGPAFEGDRIHCGMRGVDGAVDHVWLENGSIRWSVIGGGKPDGLCGSGLIDLVAALRRTGEIDETGRLTAGQDYQLGDTGIVLTQKDVREVQLAKGAISAGIALLTQKLGVQYDDIRRVYLAGAFGTYLDPASACAIGLLPSQLLEKMIPVGNAAGQGAKMVLQHEATWQRAARLAEQTEFLELASLPQFQDAFIDALEFPPVGEGARC